jgi:hypothetical protein
MTVDPRELESVTALESARMAVTRVEYLSAVACMLLRRRIADGTASQDEIDLIQELDRWMDLMIAEHIAIASGLANIRFGIPNNSELPSSE